MSIKFINRHIVNELASFYRSIWAEKEFPAIIGWLACWKLLLPIHSTNALSSEQNCLWQLIERKFNALIRWKKQYILPLNYVWLFTWVSRDFECVGFWKLISVPFNFAFLTSGVIIVYNIYDVYFSSQMIILICVGMICLMIYK